MKHNENAGNISPLTTFYIPFLFWIATQLSFTCRFMFEWNTIQSLSVNGVVDLFFIDKLANFLHSISLKQGNKTVQCTCYTVVYCAGKVNTEYSGLHVGLIICLIRNWSRYLPSWYICLNFAIICNQGFKSSSHQEIQQHNENGGKI